ncbi:MAG TPA: hypothetical protein VF789_20635 [Thermoanaerobaculia bacterium]
MSTTAIFVELLVIGIQTALWVMLVVATFQPEVIHPPELSKWEGLITAGAFAVCYSLGILVDRIADLIFVAARPKDVIDSAQWIKRWRNRISNEKIDTSALALAFKEGKASEYLDYFRSRIRITRALSVNALLATVALIIFLTIRCDSINLWLVIPIVCLLGGGISVFAFFAVGGLDLANNAQKDEVKRLLQKDNPVEKAQNPGHQADG